MNVAANAYEEMYLAGRASVFEEQAKSRGEEYTNAHPYYHPNERLRVVWKDMKSRCNNKNSGSYKDYGGRGISVCREWNENYFAFREWAYKTGYNPDAPKGECTLDRIDVDGNYCPENCRWVDMVEQYMNRRDTVNYFTEERAAQFRRKSQKKKMKKELLTEAARALKKYCLYDVEVHSGLVGFNFDSEPYDAWCSKDVWLSPENMNEIINGKKLTGNHLSSVLGDTSRVYIEAREPLMSIRRLIIEYANY